MTKDIYPDKPCEKCEFEKQWIVKKTVNQANKPIYQFVCNHCEYRSSYFLKATKVKYLGYEPDFIEPRNTRHPCSVCGNLGAENHHWAPVGIFGDEADKWPTDYLCKTCHDRWHSMVTPSLVGK